MRIHALKPNLFINPLDRNLQPDASERDNRPIRVNRRRPAGFRVPPNPHSHTFLRNQHIFLQTRQRLVIAPFVPGVEFGGGGGQHFDNQTRLLAVIRIGRLFAGHHHIRIIKSVGAIQLGFHVGDEYTAGRALQMATQNRGEVKADEVVGIAGAVLDPRRCGFGVLCMPAWKTKRGSPDPDQCAPRESGLALQLSHTRR